MNRYAWLLIKTLMIILCFNLFACGGGGSTTSITAPSSQSDAAVITTTTPSRTNNPPSWLEGLELSVPLIPQTELAFTTLDIFQSEYWLVWSEPTLGAIAKSKSNTQVTLDPESLPPGEHTLTVSAYSPLDFAMSNPLDQQAVTLSITGLSSTPTPTPAPTPTTLTGSCVQIDFSCPIGAFTQNDGNRFSKITNHTMQYQKLNEDPSIPSLDWDAPNITTPGGGMQRTLTHNSYHKALFNRADCCTICYSSNRRWCSVIPTPTP